MKPVALLLETIVDISKEILNIEETEVNNFRNPELSSQTHRTQNQITSNIK